MDDFERAKQKYEEELAEREQAYLEELRAREEEERRARLEAQKRQFAKRLLEKQAKARAAALMGKAGKAGGRLAATGARAAGAFVAEAAAAVAPVVLPILLIVAIILGIVFLVLVTLTALCNADNLTGSLARVGSKIASPIVGADYCDALSGGLGGLVTYFDQGQIPPPGGEVCPANIQPPKGAVIDCRVCINMETRGIPVKPRPPAGSTDGANPFAHPEAARLLSELLLKNTTWRVTEAFCPVVNHSEAKHYDGQAIDINLKPEYSGDKAKLAQLYLDAKAGGFSTVLCEYPPDYLKDYGVSCVPYGTTQGGHIHLEVSVTQ